MRLSHLHGITHNCGSLSSGDTHVDTKVSVDPDVHASPHVRVDLDVHIRSRVHVSPHTLVNPHIHLSLDVHIEVDIHV